MGLSLEYWRQGQLFHKICQIRKSDLDPQTGNWSLNIKKEQFGVKLCNLMLVNQRQHKFRVFFSSLSWFSSHKSNIAELLKVCWKDFIHIKQKLYLMNILYIVIQKENVILQTQLFSYENVMTLMASETTHFFQILSVIADGRRVPV